MGSDIYLSWKGMRKKEKDSQITGFSIEDGHTGYLRASIGMVLENRVLRLIFPDKYWNNPSGRPLIYDFNAEENQIKFKKGVWVYLMSILTGRSEEIIKRIVPNDAEIMGKGIEKMLNETFEFDKIIKTDGCLDIFGAITWVKSVLDFYVLGMEKQKDGLKPKVYISW